MTGLPVRDTGLDLLVLSVADPTGIVGAVCEQPVSLRKITQEGGRVAVIADLSDGDDEADGSSVGISKSVQLGVRA